MAPNNPTPSRFARRSMRMRTTERARQGMDDAVEDVPVDEVAVDVNAGPVARGEVNTRNPDAVNEDKADLVNEDVVNKVGQDAVLKDVPHNVNEEDPESGDEEVGDASGMEFANADEAEQGVGSLVGQAGVGVKSTIGKVVSGAGNGANVSGTGTAKARTKGGRIVLVDMPVPSGAYMYQSTLDGLVYKGRNKQVAKKSFGGKVEHHDAGVPGSTLTSLGGGSVCHTPSPGDGGRSTRRVESVGGGSSGGPSGRQTVPAVPRERRAERALAPTCPAGPPGFPPLPAAPPVGAWVRPSRFPGLGPAGLLGSHGVPPLPAAGALPAAVVRTPLLPSATGTASTHAAGSVMAAAPAGLARQGTQVTTRYAPPPPREAAMTSGRGESSLPPPPRRVSVPGRVDTPPPSTPRWSGPPPQRWTGALTPPPRRDVSPSRAAAASGGAGPTVRGRSVVAAPPLVIDLVDNAPDNTPPASPLPGLSRLPALGSTSVPSSRSPSPRPSSGKRRRREERHAARAEATVLEEVASLIKTGLASVRAELTRVKAELVIVKTQAASALRKMDAMAAAGDADSGGNANVLERMAVLERLMVEMREQLTVDGEEDAPTSKAGLAKNDAVVLVNKVKVCWLRVLCGDMHLVC